MVNYNIYQVLPLQLLPIVNGVYQYNFDNICNFSTGTTMLSICNTDGTPIEIINTIFDDTSFFIPQLSGLTINDYNCYDFNVNFIPNGTGSFSTSWTGITSSGDQILLNLSGTSNNSLSSFINYCFTCPTGYILDIDNTTCTKTQYTGVTYPDLSTIYTATTSPTNSNYGLSSVFYVDITSSVLPIIDYFDFPDMIITDSNNIQVPSQTVVSNTFWGSGSTTSGRLNDVGIWTQYQDVFPNNSMPINTWIGYTYCLNLSETETYYIGVGGDNGVRIDINGKTFVYLDTGGLNYKYWHVFPITLNSGINNIQLYGYNGGGPASFGSEIYNVNSLSILTAATNITEAGVIWNTKQQIGNIFDLAGYSGYTCPVGYIYTDCNNNPTCSIIDKVPSTAITSCFIDFGPVPESSVVTLNKSITNYTNTDLLITFSGNPSDFRFDNPLLLTPGINNVEFKFNPQLPYGDKSTTLILQGNCYNEVIKLCGSSYFGTTVRLDIENNSSFVNCCNNITLKIQNNLFDNNNPITIIDVQSPVILSGGTILNPILNKGECLNIDYTFCPLISGTTNENIIVNYLYQTGNTIFTGTSEINFTLSGFTHPLDLISTTCETFKCSGTTKSVLIPIDNPTENPLTLYYFFNPNDNYDFTKIFNLNIPTPFIIPPHTTSGLTLSINTSELTSGNTFNDTFYFNLVDTNCCRDKQKCIQVSFCPTTITPDFGYPKNVSCAYCCDGELKFTVNDCGDECRQTITWNTNLHKNFGPEKTFNCGCSNVFLSENGCAICSEDVLDLSNYTNQTQGDNLMAGDYTITVNDGCCNTVNKTFTITQPDPLFVNITWANSKNYCKTDIQELCGIVDSPDINPSGYVTIDKGSIIKVINNDINNIVGQRKTGSQEYSPDQNQTSKSGLGVDPINSFKNYILNFFSGASDRYKSKWYKESNITVESWNDVVRDIIGDGCCFAGFVIGGTSPYSYSWYDNNGYISNSPNIFNRPCCEEHTLVVTDYNGCTYSATSTCLDCTFGISNLTKINPSDNYGHDGLINISVSANCSSSIIQMSLENNNVTQYYTGNTKTFTGLTVGDYLLNVSDLNSGCSLDPINIELKPKYSFTVTENITGTTCQQRCDGRLQVNVNVINNEDNISNNFVYILNNVLQFSNIFTGLCSSNNQNLIVANAQIFFGSGYYVEKYIDIPNSNLFNIVTEEFPASGIYSPDGKIIINVTNGVSKCIGYECYELNNVITTFNNGLYTIENLLPGTYNFEIKDQNNCTKIFTCVVGYVKNINNVGRSEGINCTIQYVNTFGGSQSSTKCNNRKI